MILKIKYRFAEFPLIFLTSKRELWQEPFKSGRNNYGFRQIKEKVHQGQVKYQINNRWITKKRLNESAYIVSEKIDNNQLAEKYLPFNK